MTMQTKIRGHDPSPALAHIYTPYLLPLGCLPHAARRGLSHVQYRLVLFAFGEGRDWWHAGKLEPLYAMICTLHLRYGPA